jgi:DNA-binding beta-propeller fold protein YncE
MKMQLTRRAFLQVSAAFAAAGIVRADAPAGKLVTIAGAGMQGMAAEGDDALAAHLNNPYGLIEPADASALFFVDNGSNRVLKLDYASKRISIVAGTGMKGFAGDGGPAKMSQLAQPHEIRFARNGDLYVVERDNYVVRRIDMKTGVIVTIAGTPQKNGFSGDGGPADKAQFNQPHGIAIHPDGDIYVCDVLNNRVRRVDAKTGTITTFAGNGETGHTPDAGPLVTSPIQGPRSLEITKGGKIYLALREGNAIVELDGKSGKIKHVAGTGENGYSGDGGPASRATFGSSGAGGLTGPKGLASSADGRMLYVADCENHVVRKIDLKTGIISTVAGTGKRGNGADGDPLQCALARPHGVYVRDKVLYIADSENHKIRTLTPA